MPIMAGIVAGYIASLAYGIIDFTPVAQASWLSLPNFTYPEFNINAILFMIPVALAPAIEHVGDILAISNATGKDYLKNQVCIVPLLVTDWRQWLRLCLARHQIPPTVK